MLRAKRFETPAGAVVTVELERTPSDSYCIQLSHDDTRIRYAVERACEGVALVFDGMYQGDRLVAASAADYQQPGWAAAVLEQFRGVEVAA